MASAWINKTTKIRVVFKADPTLFCLPEVRKQKSLSPNYTTCLFRDTTELCIFTQRQQYCAFAFGWEKNGTNYSTQTSKTLERIPLGEEHSLLPQGQGL